MTGITLTIGFGTPFNLQIDYLANKIRLPTERANDITRGAHDRAFVVAGASKADLLADLQGAIVKAAESGGGLNEFRKDFKSIVAKQGWSGWTGEGSKEGEAWRTRVIYQTNMATSYAAGRRAQMKEPSYVRFHPFWRYLHSDGVLHPRPQHLAWHGLTLPQDHPFWDTHFAPNGYGCQCRITSVTQREGEASAEAGLGDPPEGWQDINPKTGEPVGIDKGFGYAPGANVDTPLQKLIDDKLIKLDAPLGAAMAEALQPALVAERTVIWQRTFDLTRSSMQSVNATVMVHTLEPGTVAALATEHGITLDNAAVWMRDKELLHALRDSKAQRGAALPDSVWRDLPKLLQTAVPYFDSLDKALIYAIDLAEKLGKVVLKIDTNLKGRFDGARATIKSNFVQTGGLVDVHNVESDGRYIQLKK